MTKTITKPKQEQPKAKTVVKVLGGYLELDARSQAYVEGVIQGMIIGKNSSKKSA
ncbi:hypothetical protein ACTQ3M_05025 [Oscillospiraceae bacterium LCP25S3_E10]